MKVIRARNVCEALPLGMEYLQSDGELENSRAGQVLVAPEPVTTVYERPTERVLFSRGRNANPFFHLMEAMWMLAGRDDAGFLNTYVKDFGARFAEPGGQIHDAYGYRWRRQWEYDQLERIIKLLRQEPGTRQAVLQMWDPRCDNFPGWKTRPCNTAVYFRINSGALDITVTCRSNDIIWGAYGANAVHFSVMQEYIAACVGVPVGRYYQISNNYHAYCDVFNKLLFTGSLDDQRYPLKTQKLVDDPDTFMEELDLVLADRHITRVLKNRFLAETVWPMMQNHKHRQIVHIVAAEDWRMAGSEWIKGLKKPTQDKSNTDVRSA